MTTATLSILAHNNRFARKTALATALLACLPFATSWAAEDGTQANPYTLTSATNPLNDGYWHTLGNDVTYSANNALFGYGTTTGTGLIVSSGYTLRCIVNSRIAYDTGSSFNLIVDGGTFTTTGELSVGRGGNGTLLVQNGGTVSAGSAKVGQEVNAAASSTFTVTGTGSSFTTTGALEVGYNSTGTFSLESGATASSSGVNVGAEAQGTFTVTGSNSTFTNAGSLSIGGNKAASFTVSNGGKFINNGQLNMGYATGAATKTLTVTGAGSKLTVTDVSYIGYQSSASMTISDGGVVSTSGSANYVGYSLTGNTSTVTVTGNGSAWLNTGSLTLGRSDATGTLTIEDGALVTASSLEITDGSKLYLKNGFLALSSTDATTDAAILQAYLDGGSTIYAYDNASSAYVLVTDSNYTSFVSLKYYSDISTCTALSSYNLSGAYTVLTAVPEPATYAVFGGIGALGLALLKRRKNKE